MCKRAQNLLDTGIIDTLTNYGVSFGLEVSRCFINVSNLTRMKPVLVISMFILFTDP